MAVWPVTRNIFKHFVFIIFSRKVRSKHIFLKIFFFSTDKKQTFCIYNILKKGKKPTYNFEEFFLQYC